MLREWLIGRAQLHQIEGDSNRLHARERVMFPVRSAADAIMRLCLAHWPGRSQLMHTSIESILEVTRDAYNTSAPSAPSHVDVQLFTSAWRKYTSDCKAGMRQMFANASVGDSTFERTFFKRITLHNMFTSVDDGIFIRDLSGGINDSPVQLLCMMRDRADVTIDASTRIELAEQQTAPKRYKLEDETSLAHELEEEAKNQANEHALANGLVSLAMAFCDQHWPARSQLMLDVYLVQKPVKIASMFARVLANRVTPLEMVAQQLTDDSGVIATGCEFSTDLAQRKKTVLAELRTVVASPQHADGHSLVRFIQLNSDQLQVKRTSTRKRLHSEAHRVKMADYRRHLQVCYLVDFECDWHERCIVELGKLYGPLAALFEVPACANVELDALVVQTRKLCVMIGADIDALRVRRDDLKRTVLVSPAYRASLEASSKLLAELKSDASTSDVDDFMAYVHERLQTVLGAAGVAPRDAIAIALKEFDQLERVIVQGGDVNAPPVDSEWGDVGFSDANVQVTKHTARAIRELELKASSCVTPRKSLATVIAIATACTRGWQTLKQRLVSERRNNEAGADALATSTALLNRVDGVDFSAAISPTELESFRSALVASRINYQPIIDWYALQATLLVQTTKDSDIVQAHITESRDRLRLIGSVFPSVQATDEVIDRGSATIVTWKQFIDAVECMLTLMRTAGIRQSHATSVNSYAPTGLKPLVPTVGAVSGAPVLPTM